MKNMNDELQSGYNAACAALRAAGFSVADEEAPTIGVSSHQGCYTRVWVWCPIGDQGSVTVDGKAVAK